MMKNEKHSGLFKTFNDNNYYVNRNDDNDSDDKEDCFLGNKLVIAKCVH